MSRPGNSVDHVLDRMVEAVLGKNAHFKSHALALNIPRETIKSWKRRGEVPLGFLKGFALDWKVSLEWLLHGEQQSEAHLINQDARPRGLSEEEAALLETYRSIDPAARVTLQELLKVIAGGGQVERRATPKLRSGGPVKRVEPVMRSGDLSKTKKPPRKIRKADEST